MAKDVPAGVWRVARPSFHPGLAVAPPAPLAAADHRRPLVLVLLCPRSLPELVLASWRLEQRPQPDPRQSSDLKHLAQKLREAGEKPPFERVGERLTRLSDLS